MAPKDDEGYEVLWRENRRGDKRTGPGLRGGAEGLVMSLTSNTEDQKWMLSGPHRRDLSTTFSHQKPHDGVFSHGWCFRNKATSLRHKAH